MARTSADPIFAALAREHRAAALLVHRGEFGEHVSRQHIAAVDALAKTRPTTIRGARALIAHRLGKLGDTSDRVLVVVQRALARLPA